MQMMTNTLLKLFEQQLITKQVAYLLLKEVETLKDSVQVAPRHESVAIELSTETRALLERWQRGEGQGRLALGAVFAFLGGLLVNKPAYALLVVRGEERRHLELDLPGSASFAAMLDQLAQAGALAGSEVVAGAYELALLEPAPAPDQELPCSLLACSLELTANGLQPRLHFRAGALEDGWTAGLALQFDHFLRAFLERPEAPADELDLLPPVHKELLRHYNQTSQYVPQEKTTHELFYAQAARTPERVAIAASGELRSYAQVNQRSNQLAHLLVDLGAKPNDLIGVIAHREVELPIALLGVLKSGAAYVPMEPTYPSERVDHILRNTRARVLVTTAAVLAEGRFDLDSLPELKYIVCLDAWQGRKFRARVLDQARIARQRRTDLAPRSKPEDLAYIIFTSGSTGKPKGVVIRHYSVVNTIVGINNLYGVTREDKVFCFSSVCFDLSVYDMFGAWAVGAEVVFASERQIKDPQALMDLIERRGATIWDSVPTGMKQLVLGLEHSGRQNSTLRLVMLSGEFIPLTLPDAIRRHFPKTRITSLGGATEGTVWSIYYYPVEQVDPRWNSIPYGKPLANQTYQVLNEKLQPCALGQVGMLYIGGKGVAAGYFNDPERTAAAFIQNPLSQDPSDIIYRTGDLGRMRFDGNIEIMGRADSQVKIRGFRVEMGEVEAQLELCPQVEECAILVKRDEDGNNRLVAYYVAAEQGVAAGQLRDWLTAKLPAYMVPSQFIKVERMPVNASGKLDRKALARIGEGTSVETQQDFVAPESENQRTVAGILCELLRLERVGLHDDFFLIGGDSLLSLQYSGKLKAAGFQAGPADIFNHPTIAGLLAHLASGGGVAGDARAHEPGPVALGPMQRRFFQVLQLAEPDHWNQSIELAVPRSLDLDRLEQALAAVVAHHPSLRTRFRQEDGQWHQEVVAELACPLMRLHCKGLTVIGRLHHLKQLKLELQQGIHIERGPLMRLAHVTQRGNHDLLIWTAHHLLTDAYCWRVLIEDLAAAYASLSAGETPRLSRSDAYRSYVETLGEVALRLPDDERRHWQELLSRQRFVVPVDRAQASNLERDTVSLRWNLGVAETRELQERLRERGATLHDAVLTAFTRSLGAWTGNRQVAVDIVSNGRDVRGAELDMSRTIGWCAPIHPFTTEHGEVTPCESLAIVQRDWQEHQRYQNHFLPLRFSGDHDLAEQFAEYRDQDVLFNYLGDFDSVAVDPSWQIRGNAGLDRGAANRRTHLLEFEGFVAGDRLIFALHYAKGLHRAGQIRNLRDHFKTALLALR